MAVYALWNNKGGVGKSYLTFKIASEYALTHPEQKVLVIDLCPQANSSIMLLGGMLNGESVLNRLSENTNKTTISGYIDDRVRSPYSSTRTGSGYLVRLSEYNPNMPDNLYLVPGDESLEMLSSRISKAAQPGPDDAWRIVHLWIRDLINDVKASWGQSDTTVFIDCNPSFTTYTELAIAASDRLIIPFTADGSSKRAVRSVLSLVYGFVRLKGQQQSEFFLNSRLYSLAMPGIYFYIGNRLTQGEGASAVAFKAVVNGIGEEIWQAWRVATNNFHIHPTGSGAPANQSAFKKMFQYEILDANSASVVSSALGIPISTLKPGTKAVLRKEVRVNASQLEKQRPNIQELVNMIE